MEILLGWPTRLLACASAAHVRECTLRCGSRRASHSAQPSEFLSKVQLHLFILVVLTFSFSAFADQNSDQQDCKKSVDELGCVLSWRDSNSGEELYRTDPDYFWAVLHKNRDDALQCNHGAVVNLLKANKIGFDGELGEWMSETIEDVCMKKPKCFMDGMAKLKKTEQQTINNLLEHAVFHNPKELIVCQAKLKE